MPKNLQMTRQNYPETAETLGGASAAEATGALEACEPHGEREDALNGLTSLLRQVLFDLTHAVDRKLAGRALTFAKSIPLIALIDGRRHTASSIARKVRCNAGAITRIIDELEDKGLVTRERSRADRRVVHLQLTASGREVARNVPAVLHEVMETNLADLTGSERQVLTGLLRRVAQTPTWEPSVLDRTRQAPARHVGRTCENRGAGQAETSMSEIDPLAGARRA